MSESELTANRSSREKVFGKVLGRSALAGALLGGLQGLVGYFPRLNAPLMIISAAGVGLVVATVLGAIIYLTAFRGRNVFAALNAVAWVSGVCGVAAAMFFRWWTGGEGAILSADVTLVAALVTTTAIRAYIWFDGLHASARTGETDLPKTHVESASGTLL
jgi:hypothetical protein